MTENCYKSFIETKTGTLIPCFENGRTVESRYDPLKESIRLVSEYNKNTGFFIVFGIAGGFLINTILEQFPSSFVIGVELNQSSIEYLSSLEQIKHIKQNNNCILCSLENCEDIILNNYIPAFYGQLQIIQQRSWIENNIFFSEKINKSISDIMNKIKADYSVQSHFGKIWQNNIINNLKLIQNYQIPKITFPTNKTAVVVAAGSSFENQIPYLKENRSSLYIISTDTSFSSLTLNNIIPDAVISIDGQNISYSHFFNNGINFTDILFAFDLCGNYNAVKNILDNNGKLVVFNSGHPLCNLASKDFPKLYSGSGTITITSLDFAIKAGFSNIKVIGADFSYSNRKPYTKGTYLDKQFYSKNFKLFTEENLFDKLMFRTETFNNQNNVLTSPILESYKNSFLEYINSFGSYTYSNDIYDIQINNPFENFSFTTDFDYELFKSKIKNIKIPISINAFSDLNEELISFLPLISYLRLYDNINVSLFIDFLNKAYNFTIGKL